MIKKCYHYGKFQNAYKNGIKIVAKTRNKKQKQQKKHAKSLLKIYSDPNNLPQIESCLTFLYFTLTTFSLLSTTAFHNLQPLITTTAVFEN